MYSLEIAFVLLVVGLLVAQNVRGIPRAYGLVLLAAGLVSLLLGGWLGQVRWQMAPAYLVFGALAMLSLKASHSHVAVRSVGVVLASLLLAGSVFLSLGLPILKLPAPDGPEVVGSTSLSLTDETRDNSFFAAPDEAREVYVQIWYPGAIAADQPTPRVRTLWEELYRGDRDRFTLFSGYLRGTKTHSYVDIPWSGSQARYPAIVFSHGMGSFAEQSTLLMEHLASHGYVVLAIGHPYASMRVVSSTGTAIYLDLDKLNEVSAPFDAEAAAVTATIGQASSAEERMRLQMERYERAGHLNALMATWVDDLTFVLDSIDTPAGRDLRLQSISQRIDAERIGFLGMSFGGGAVTEVCKSDARCSAGLNMDGGTFGQRQRQPLEVPYLALTRENQDTLDYLLPASRSDYYAVEVKGATHLDFTDDTIVLPILSWLSVTGDVAGERAIEITNAVSLRFFDAYLRDGPKPRFSEDLPELEIEMNGHAREQSAP